MHIVKDLKEFKRLLSNPNPNEVYGYVPNGYSHNISANLHSKITSIFEVNKNSLVYTDILEYYGPYLVPRVNPSFDAESMAKNGFKLNSPIFIKTDNPVGFDREDISEITLQLLQQVIGIHIPEFCFIWKDPLTETNTQS